jgi:hypothetical protein
MIQRTRYDKSNSRRGHSELRHVQRSGNDFKACISVVTAVAVVVGESTNTGGKHSHEISQTATEVPIQPKWNRAKLSIK